SKIVSSDRQNGDGFGEYVAIDGDYAIFGVPRESEDESGGNTMNQSGSAYVFKKTGGTWLQQQKITAPVRYAGVNFGNSVAINGDYIIIGCVDQRFDANEANPIVQGILAPGAAYIYKQIEE